MTERGYYCGLDAALAVVGGRWKFLVLWQLAVHGPQRFGQLRRLVEGVTEKVLTSALKDLEADGIIDRRDFRELPPRVEYSLTPFGFGLTEALRPLCEWGDAHMDRIGALPSQPVKP
ncbi:winged helix-turn-helix transcriptional regulator [Mycolicibacterium sp. Dal123E01]|uniref:winged helix-turn-helix transcriptional regulator n=1 Tax=Mycolicibacterium sp. Dal123E01 TaxID=3457578 RepID=UPI00403E640E